MARLFELGCVGAREVAGAAGPEVMAYFEDAIALPFDGTWEEVEEVDYLAAYRHGLEPVRVGPLVVAPSHSRPRLRVGEQVVWLDPGSAFGTGHHETTRLALAALGGRDLRGHSVLDVGAGSGILAIAADRLGAASALGVDTDAATVAVARNNASLNRSRASFREGGIDRLPQAARFDVLVANLYAELHARLAPDYRAHVVPGGCLLLTGILARLEGMVREALPRAWQVATRRDGKWVLLEVDVPATADAVEVP